MVFGVRHARGEAWEAASAQRGMHGRMRPIWRVHSGASTLALTVVQHEHSVQQRVWSRSRSNAGAQSHTGRQRSGERRRVDDERAKLGGVSCGKKNVKWKEHGSAFANGSKQQAASGAALDSSLTFSEPSMRSNRRNL